MILKILGLVQNYLGVLIRVFLVVNDFKFMGITTITPLKEISSSKFFK